MITAGNEKIINLEEKRADYEELKALTQLLENKGNLIAFTSIDEKGKPLKVWNNVEAVMKHNNIQARFNEVSKEVEVLGCSSQKLDDTIMDIHTLCQNAGLRVDTNFIGLSVNRIASKNSYNPVTAYLNECYENWDGESNRIDQVLKSITLRDDVDRFFAKKLIRKWLVQTVMIAYNKGKDKTQGILIFHGEQGLGKTTWISNLIPEELWDYFQEGKDLDIKDKDKLFSLISNWIVELGEIDGSMKQEQAKLKAFTTQSNDQLRRPYAKSHDTYPRTTSFFGTVNKDEFLKDETGSRRYWIVPVVDLARDYITQEELREFWGEVMYLWKHEGEVPYLDRMETKELSKKNEEFNTTTPTYANIHNRFKWDAPKDEWGWMDYTAIIGHCGLKTGGAALKKALVDLEVEYKRSNGSKYLMPPLNHNIPNI